MTKRQHIWLWATIIISVLLRVGVAFYLGNEVDAPEMLVDQRSYHALGARIISGHGFSFAEGWYPFTQADTPTAHWSFLYSIYVVAIYGIFGVQPLIARVISAVLGGLLLPWMAFRLTRRLFPSDVRVSILAAFCTAIYAFFVLYAATLMTEIFFIVALLWTLERSLALAAKPAPATGLVLGLGLGIATLLRQSILPWAAVLFVWLVCVGWHSRKIKRMLGSLAIAGLVIVLSILPFTIRNYVVYGEFLLLNSNAGYAMFSAQHPMHGTNFQEHAAAGIPQELWGLNEAQFDKELMRRGIGFVLDDPGRYLLLSLSRVLDYFEFWPTDTSLLHNLGRILSFGLFLPFMLYGIWKAIRLVWTESPHTRVRRLLSSPTGLILLFMSFYSLMHILTWAMPRYRLPPDAVALSFAALALCDLARWVLTARKSRTAQREACPDINAPHHLIANR